MNSGKILLGMLAGIAVGATLGILFAPKKGSTMRRRIAHKSDEYAHELGDKFNDFVGSVNDKFETVKNDATRMAKNGKHKIEEVKAEVISAVN